MQNATSQRLLAGALLLSAALATAWWLLPNSGPVGADRRPLEPLGGPWSGELLPPQTAQRRRRRYSFRQQA